MTDDRDRSREGGEDPPLRRKRAASVVPEAEEAAEARERRRRLFSEPGAIRETDAARPAPAGVQRRWRWFGRPRSEPVAPSDLAATEARTAAAREAAAALRSRLQREDDLGPDRESGSEAGSDSGSGSGSASSKEAATSEPFRRARSESDGPVRARSEPAGPVRARSEPAGPVRARSEPAGPVRARSEPAGPARARSEPVAGERFATEILPPPAWHRHDLLVIVLAALLLGGGLVVQRALVAPSLLPIDQLGLRLERPAAWLPARRIGPPTAGLAAHIGGSGDGAAPAHVEVAAVRRRTHHVFYQSAIEPTARIEVRISERSEGGDLRSALLLGRMSRHGDSHWAAGSTERTMGGRDWIRTRYRYPFKVSEGDAPVIATAIEFATVNGQLMYVVTLHGSDQTARRLERLIVPTLAVDANHPAAVGAER
jgi:hypothetical protein